MKHRTLPAALCAVLLGAAPAAAQDLHEGYTGWAVDATPVLPAEEVHPSMFFTAADRDALRAKRTASEWSARLWSAVESHRYATDALPGAAPPHDGDKDLVHQYYGDIPQFAAYNAVLYFLADDEEAAERHRQRAVAALLRAYDGDLYKIDPNERGTAADEIYRGTWGQAFCLAYDIVQPTLSPAEDAEIRARLVKEAQFLSDGLFGFVNGRPTNHLSKPAWGLGSMALCLAEEPNASEWLANCLAASNANTRFYFSGDGVSREGSHYYIFSLLNMLPFLYHYRDVAGVDLFPDFQPAFEAPIALRSPEGWMPNIEDSYIRPNPSFLSAAAYRDAPTYLSSGASLGEVLAWNWQATDMVAFDRALAEKGFNYTGASWDYPLELYDFLLHDPSVPAAAPDHSPTVFLDSGATMFRASWEDPEGPWLLFQGVADCDNHEHSEHLSFILGGAGQWMASDAGYSRSSYGEAIRLDWYATPEAHNVVLLDGKAPIDTRPNQGPTSVARLDSAFLDLEEKLAFYANGARHRRVVAFAGNEHFVVVDRVEGGEGEMTMLFHPGRVVAHEDRGGTDAWSYEDDAYGPAARLLARHAGSALRREQAMGEVTYIKGDWKEFPYLRLSTAATSRPTLSFYLPQSMDDAEVQVDDVSEGEVTALVAASGDRRDGHAARREPGPMSLLGATADADQLWIRRDRDGGVWLAARHATRVDTGGGAPLLEFDAPTTFAARLSGGELEITASGEGPRTLRVAGQPVGLPSSTTIKHKL